MDLTYQYGLRPTRRQYRALDGILEGERLLANAALQERRDAWRLAGKSVTRIDQVKALTLVRADDPDGYGTLPANLSRWTLKKIDDSFQAFFRRVKEKKERVGYPRSSPSPAGARSDSPSSSGSAWSAERWCSRGCRAG